MIVVGLHGEQGSGKDTVARHLTEQFGFVHLKFAGRLVQACMALDPVVGMGSDFGVVRFTEATHIYGYDECKRLFPEYRRTLKMLATEVCRDLFGEDVWVNFVHEQIVAMGDHDKFVISDVRFVNEARFVADTLSGCLVRIVRPDAANDDALHRSNTELGLQSFDYTLFNNSDIDTLHSRVNDMVDLITHNHLPKRES